jgi:hypothetical protein
MDNSFQEVEGKEIYKYIPAFKSVMKDIFKSYASLAISLEDELNEVKFILVDVDLPILPHQETSLSGTEVDLQVAIRKGNVVVVSTKNLELIEDSGYLVLHEILHSMVGKFKDIRPIKHTYVRSLVKFIKEDLKDSSIEQIEKKLAEYGVETSTSVFMNEQSRAVFSFVAKDEQLNEKECALLNLRYSSSVQRFSREKIFLDMYFEGIKSCKESSKGYERMYLANTSDAFKEFIREKIERTHINIYLVKEEKASILYGARKDQKESCKRNTSNDLKRELEKTLEKFNEMKEDEISFFNNFEVYDRIDEVVFNEIMTNKLHYFKGYKNSPGRLNGVIANLKRQKSKFDKNIQVCKSHFPFTNFSK